MNGQVKDVLFDEDQIRNRVRELGQQITQDYAGEKVYAICLLKGSLVFAADLIRSMELDVQIDMMRASSYEGTESTGSVKILQDLDADVADRNVLVIEDIVDTGRTLSKILNLLKFRNPKSLKVCSFLNKPSRRVVEIPIDYCGYEIEDHFVVGYGLDLNEYYRNLPYIGIFEPES
jgi:hypoxanthine phosphoribosyltransferase